MYLYYIRYIQHFLDIFSLVFQPKLFVCCFWICNWMITVIWGGIAENNKMCFLLGQIRRVANIIFLLFSFFLEISIIWLHGPIIWSSSNRLSHTTPVIPCERRTQTLTDYRITERGREYVLQNPLVLS